MKTRSYRKLDRRLARTIVAGLGVIGVLLSASSASFATSFFDNFNRPDGAVANGWSDASNNNGGTAMIRSGKLSTSNPDCNVGVNRPIGYSGIVTVSAPITEMNGFGGLLRRYSADFRFLNDGTVFGGYGIGFSRGDQNYSDSRVELFKNGVRMRTIYTPFQFGAAIFVNFSLYPDGSIKGAIKSEGNYFRFRFAARDLSQLTGTNFAVALGCPDSRSSQITYPGLNNISIDYDNPN